MVLQNQVELRIGVVNFFNAAPLIEGISKVDGITLVPKVPSELASCVERGEVDVALASSIDYQTSIENMVIIPAGVLSSDGESLTVKLCSRVPFDQITSVHCDSDSHTSVALMQIILNDIYDAKPNLISLDIHGLGACNEEWPESVLIIGDKVITSCCDTEFSFSLDLGLVWKEHFSLPFVFATWIARADLPESKLNLASMILQRQRTFNEQRIEQVVSMNANAKGWSNDLAMEYVTKHLNYEFSDKHLASLTLFYDLAEKLGLIEDKRAIRLWDA